MTLKLSHALLHGAGKLRVNVPYLVNRNGKYYFRRRVPDQLKEAIGKREWVISLGMDVAHGDRNASQATAIASRFERQTDSEIRKAALLVGTDVAAFDLADDAYHWARKNEFLAGQQGRLGGPYEETAYDDWIRVTLEATLRASGKYHEEELEESDFSPQDWMRIQAVKANGRPEVAMTMKAAAQSYAKRHKGGELPRSEAQAVAQFIEFAGDTPLRDIRRADARDWITYLAEVRQQSGSSIKRRLNSVKAIVNRAIDDFELGFDNPFNRQSIPDIAKNNRKAQEDRLPFHSSHLELIDAYLETSDILEETKDMIRLLKGTGCRPLEIGGLNRSDIILDGETPYLKIQPNENRRLKTANAERMIPLVGEALAVAQRLAKAKAGAVFSSNAHESGKLSARLNRVVRAAGVPKSTRLVAYSFRHGFEQALREAKVAPELQRYLMGHGAEGITDKYGAAMPYMGKLREAVEEGLKHLGEVAEHNYASVELAT